jgi:hypothetical protein
MKRFVQATRIAITTLLLLSSTFAASDASPLEDRIKASEDKYTRLVEEMKRKAALKTKVVYAAHEIAEGATMNANDLEEREMEFSKLPQDAMTSKALCVGRVCKNGTYHGAIISQRDLAPRFNFHSVRIILSDEQDKKLQAMAAREKKLAADVVKSWIEAKLGK